VKLAGRVALVTGGGSGIGRATAHCLAREGASVVVADRDSEAAATVCSEIAAAGGQAAAAAGDVSSAADAAAMVATASDGFGALHIVVNSAGVDLPSARSVTETTDADWDLTLAVNLSGVFRVCREALPAIAAAGGGAVVNVSSVAALIAVPAEAAYAASKGAVLALSRQMALDYAPGIRVNALCPGMVERPMRDRAAAYDAVALERRERWAQAQPLGRYGTHEEMAKVALFLVSDDSAFMTGAALVFDGGMSIH